MQSNHLATSLIHENQKPLARKVPHYRKSQLHATGSLRSKLQASKDDRHDITNAAGLHKPVTVQTASTKGSNATGFLIESTFVCGLQGALATVILPHRW
jgi:hypothetical protein